MTQFSVKQHKPFLLTILCCQKLSSPHKPVHTSHPDTSFRCFFRHLGPMTLLSWLSPPPHYSPQKWHCSLPSSSLLFALLWPSGCFDSDLWSWEELSVPRCKILLLPWEAWGYISAVCRGRNSPFTLITCPYLENTNRESWYPIHRVRLYCPYVHSFSHLGQDLKKTKKLYCLA